MDQNSKELYQQYVDINQKTADLHYAAAVLEWDQEVYMPPKGFAFRGRQLSTLASQAHELITSEQYGGILHELNSRADLDDEQKRNVELSYEDYQKNSKLPASFVEALTQQTSNNFNAWVKARKENNFKGYAPELKKMIALKRQQADLYGYTDHPYNALLDDYEKGATVAMLDPIFETVREQLPVLLDKIKHTSQVSDSFFHQHFGKEGQWQFSLDVLKGMGYDMDAGRQDYSEHPFTTSFSPADVRITTRVSEHNFASLLWSSIHEGGHALYEQGLPEGQYGLPLGSAASLSIHESQSRLWENCVGRGLPFWKHYYPILKQYFPDQLSEVSLSTFYREMNRVSPSFIRTEADELTYHFHVMIRYEIEKKLINGSLDVNDVADSWNDMYNKYLGVIPPDDKTGVLQDVHWSHGSFGYFPTYSLGSFYAAQFFEQAQKDIPGFVGLIEDGKMLKLREWLREKVHKHGRRFTSEELCKRITGRGLDFSSFMGYAKSKFEAIYDIK